MGSDWIYGGLHGRNAHVDPVTSLEGLDWMLVGKKPKNVDHSIWQLVLHMIFWQDLVLDYLKGKQPKLPETNEDSWCEKAAPQDESQWNGAVLQFTAGIMEAEREAEKDLEEAGFQIGATEMTRGDLLQTIVTHNSYHIGQVVLLRKCLGAWPDIK